MIKKALGFTMLELIIVVAILAVLLTMAVPSFKNQIERSQLKGAAELFYSNLRLAKSEAVIRNKPVFVSLKQTGDAWCQGMSDQNICDCTVTDINSDDVCSMDGNLHTLNSSGFKDIAMNHNFPSNGNFKFGGIRNLPTRNGTTTFTTTGNTYIKVILSRLGRIRICSTLADTDPKGIAGYPNC